jgi:transcription elongation GreA/GreB family factor
MKLLKEQVKYLTDELKHIEEERKQLIKGKEDIHPIINEGQTTDINYENIIRIGEIVRRKEEIRELLEDSTIINPSTSKSIKIGSTFTAFISFNEKDSEELTYTLIEKRVSREPLNDYVSLDSPLGKAVLDKKIGEYFTYPIGNNLVSGTIEEVKHSTKNKADSKSKVKTR